MTFRVESLVVNPDGFDDLIKNIQLKKAYYKNQSTQFAYVLESELKTGLSNVLGSRAKHFNVIVERTADGAAVNLRSIDYIAIWLYHGTRAHTIDSSNPMPIYPNEGIFRYSVNHPGQKPMKPEIDEAIKEARLKARRMVKTL